MKRRGIVMVRAQYARDRKTGRRNRRTKSAADLAGLKDYFEDPDHANHAGIRILRCRPWRTTLETFVPAVVSAATNYRKIAKHRPGAHWKGDIAEHLIAAPDAGSDMSDAEVERLATRILHQISPRSPAVWAAHFDEKTKTWEIHFAISAFTDELTPQLRVTDLRRRECADYGLLIDEAGFVALRELNIDRAQENRPLVRSLSDLHAAKIDSVAEVVLRHEEAVQHDYLSDSSLLALLCGSHWHVEKKSKGSVSLVSPEFTTPLHVRWPELRIAIKRKSRSIQRGHGQNYEYLKEQEIPNLD
jgi:hypothetical protein